MELFARVKRWFSDPGAPSRGESRRKMFRTVLSFQADRDTYWMWDEHGGIISLDEEQHEKLKMWASQGIPLRTLRRMAKDEFG